MKLLIVESPAKCSKIQGFLGAGWRVQATMGHIRALKEDLSAIGFKSAEGWKPEYEQIASKSRAIGELRRLAASAEEIYLGSDDDREGEAIAWHVCELLRLNPATTPRVIFHEITESALKAAVARPGRIDMNKCHAQQARSMLDMLLGFTLSPCLWRGVGFKPGLSAGRCQTPALRLVYDRDTLIEGHAAKNVWRVGALSEDVIEDSMLDWTAATEYESQEAVTALFGRLATASGTQVLTVTDRTDRVSVSQPPKPFITSSLQQEASNRLGLAPKATMKAAQTLYEAGHITYMRTDNAILSQEAIEAASAVVTEHWGAEYLGGVSAAAGAGEGAGAAPPKRKMVKKGAATTAKPEAQAAHEGIRPTHMEIAELTDVSAQEKRLYELIWKRTLQSVMAPETRDVTRLTATAAPLPAAELTLHTTWDRTAFAGWRILDAERKEEQETYDSDVYDARADIAVGQTLSWKTFTATEQRTSPPARYTEASLIHELEHRGIGRPSTYATLVETVLDREYVERTNIAPTPTTLGVIKLDAGKKTPKQTTRTEKLGGEKNKLRTTALGRTVIEWLLANFGDMIDYDVTAAMEAQLDAVSRGAQTWSTVLDTTWDRYKERYDTIMTAPKTAGPTVSARRAEFGDGYKMIVSKKGPLFVLEREGHPAQFASVPAHLSLSTATRADAEAAFAAKSAAAKPDVLGELDGTPVERKKGPYGYYVTWGTTKANCKETDTLADVTHLLRAKAGAGGGGITEGGSTAVHHIVGAYTIKRGPYGLYMYKTPAPGSKTKPKFVGIPEATPWATLTPEGAETLYAHASAAAAEKKKTKKKE